METIKLPTNTRNGNGHAPVNVQIKPVNLQVVEFHLRGIEPLCINRFSAKAMEKMIETQKAGSQAKSKKNREAKDFEQCFQDARHLSSEGWDGVAASAFRCALISACRTVDFKMTLAKLSLFVIADGYDKVDGTPLVRITKGQPSRVDSLVRNDTGVVDIRPRPVWQPGWEMKVRIRYDADRFSIEDVTNLMMRVGLQVGIGEGRPDSKDSAGIGYGLFEIVNE
jgi:hypothetical protein